jgi:hypothetical protein
LAEEPWVPQLSGETRGSELAPALSRFAHLGERAQARSGVASQEIQSPPRISAEAAEGRAEPTENKKVSFWRRIALPRTVPHSGTPTLSLESLLERIHALESQSAVHQAQNEERLARSENALREIQEHDRDVSLNALRERLAGLEIDQTESEEALRRATGGLKILGTLLAAALACGVGALVFLRL